MAAIPACLGRGEDTTADHGGIGGVNDRALVRIGPFLGGGAVKKRYRFAGVDSVPANVMPGRWRWLWPKTNNIDWCGVTPTEDVIGAVQDPV